MTVFGLVNLASFRVSMETLHQASLSQCTVFIFTGGVNENMQHSQAIKCAAVDAVRGEPILCLKLELNIG